MMHKPIIVATGHRPKGLGVSDPYSDRVQNILLGIARDAIRAISNHHRGVRDVITGMALGWEMAVAEAAYQLGIPFTAVIPVEGQESRWNEKDQERYRRLLGLADNRVIVSEDSYRPDVMPRQNEWMLEKAIGACRDVDGEMFAPVIMLALYSGTRTGGTAQFIDYAEERAGQPFDRSKMLSTAGPVDLYNVWENWLEQR